jgi:hypothetical protein
LEESEARSEAAGKSTLGILQVQELQLTEFLVVLFFSKSFYYATLNGSGTNHGE